MFIYFIYIVVLPTYMSVPHLWATVVFPRPGVTDSCAGTGERVLWKASSQCHQQLTQLYSPKMNFLKLKSGSDGWINMLG